MQIKDSKSFPDTSKVEMIGVNIFIQQIKSVF